MISIYKSRYSAIILFAICLIMEIPLWAQQKAIQGTVKDIEGNPMPGVTIMVDGTNIGTITNTDGKYSINIPEKRKSLTFSFLGYISQTLDIVGQQTINVFMRLMNVIALL